MLTNVHEKQTEQLAKKHGRATNQKSSFTNLLKGKIVRAQRNVDDKENQKAHMIVQSKCSQAVNQTNILKIKEKSNAAPTVCQKYQKSESEMHNKKRLQLNRNTHESSIQTVSQTQQYRLKTSSSHDITPLSLSIKNLKLNTFENQTVAEASCMTDECYYQKQLEIKVQILKKERDQLWDSINGIVRQNNLLKETLQTISLKKQSSLCQTTQTEIKFYTSEGFQTDYVQLISQSFQTDVINHQSQGFQTDNIENPSIIVQTQITNTQLELLQLRYQKAIKERSEVLQFCETLYLQDLSEELSQCLNMKDAITEYLSMKIDGLIKQFESQKVMLNKMYEQYINKFKKNEEELLERNQGLLIDLQEAKSVNKKLLQNAQSLEKKIEMLEQSNYILNNELIEAEEQIVEYRNQAELIKQSLVSEKKSWEQRKKTYNTLLTGSHRTINNLMAQMKEFEGLASSTYYKRLQMEKNQHNINNDI